MSKPERPCVTGDNTAKIVQKELNKRREMIELRNHPCSSEHTLRVEAKPLSDLLWENRLEWDEWLRLGVTENKRIQLAAKYQSLWLPVAVAEEDRKVEIEKVRKDLTEEIHRLDHEVAIRNKKIQKLEVKLEKMTNCAKKLTQEEQK